MLDLLLLSKPANNNMEDGEGYDAVSSYHNSFMSIWWVMFVKSTPLIQPSSPLPPRLVINTHVKVEA